MSPVILALNRQIADAQTAIAAFQQECPHTETHQRPGANTGGYDGPAFDMYWVDHTCKEGGKWWRQDVQ